MKKGDIVIVVQNFEEYQNVFPKDKELRVEAFEVNSKGRYFVGLEGFPQYLFPEEDFKVVAVDKEPNPYVELTDKLNFWRSSLIHYQNEEDEGGVKKCNDYIDFFLDKWNVQKKCDAKQNVPLAVVSRYEQGELNLHG